MSKEYINWPRRHPQFIEFRNLEDQKSHKNAIDLENQGQIT